MQRVALGGGAKSLVKIAFLMAWSLTSSAARAADPAAPIAVVLHSESPELTQDLLERALTEELGIAAVPANSPESTAARGVLTVTYRPRTRELVVSYSEAARGTVTRVVPAPERVPEVSGLAALVAANLIRDQTAELLDAETSAPVAAIAAVPTPLAPTPLPVSKTEVPPSEAPVPVHWRGNAAFFYPLATNANVPELETNFDFNLLYGHIGALNGLGLGTVSTVSGNAQGLQVSAITNLVGGQVHAGQFSAIFNRGRSVEGVQVALMNRSDEAMQGLQLGALNLAGSLSKGLQLSALNVASNFEGVQIGLINVGKRVRGVQLGLINVSDDVDGVPIGLVSVSKSGGVHPVIWSSNTTYGNLGVKFGTRYTYTMLSGAMHSDGDHALYGGGFSIGASIPVAKRIATEIDVQALHLFADASCTQQSPTPGFGRAYYPQPAEPATGQTCAQQPTTSLSPMESLSPYTIPHDSTAGAATDAPFTSANARRYDQSLAKLRALLRFELFPHLSLFVGTGVTGQVTYPVVSGDTVVTFRLLSELFGGVQL
jgi:hypothetical protein